MTRYPHESPILMGMLLATIGILVILWRVQNPWIPPYSEVSFADDMDYIPIIGCVFCVTGISLIITDLMPGGGE